MKKYDINIQSLTLRQLAEVEKLTGSSIGRLFTDMDTTALASVAYVVAKKDQPELTLDDVLDWPIGAINVVDGSADPKDAGSTTPS